MVPERNAAAALARGAETNRGQTTTASSIGGTVNAAQDIVNLRHGRRTNNNKDYKDYKHTVTFATGEGLTAGKD